MDNWCKKSAKEVERVNMRKYSQVHNWKYNFTDNNGKINRVVIWATHGGSSYFNIRNW